MRHCRYISAVLILLLFCTTPGTASASGALAEAKRLNDQVVLLYWAGRNADAIALAQRSLAVLEKALGLDHPYMVKTLTNLAKLCEEIGKGEEAAVLSAQAKTMQERLVGW